MEPAFLLHWSRPPSDVIRTPAPQSGLPPGKAASKAPSQQSPFALTKSSHQPHKGSLMLTHARPRPLCLSPVCYPTASWASNSARWESLTPFLKDGLAHHLPHSHGTRLGLVWCPVVTRAPKGWPGVAPGPEGCDEAQASSLLGQPAARLPHQPHRHRAGAGAPHGRRLPLQLHPQELPDPLQRLVWTQEGRTERPCVVVGGPDPRVAPHCLFQQPSLFVQTKLGTPSPSAPALPPAGTRAQASPGALPFILRQAGCSAPGPRPFPQRPSF